MTALFRSLALAGLLAVTAGCRTVDYYRDFDPAADFGSYQTYVFAEDLLEEREDRRGLSDLDVRRVIGLLETVLAEKGLTEATSGAAADLVVDFSFSTEEILDIETFGGPAFVGGVGYYPYGPGFGYLGGGQQLSVDQRTEGTLVVDLIDHDGDRLVWRGFAVRAVDGFERREGYEREAAFELLVRGILEMYPPETAGG